MKSHLHLPILLRGALLVSPSFSPSCAALTQDEQALVEAVRSKDDATEQLTKLLNKKPAPNVNLKMPGGEGATLLHWACNHGYFKKAACLIEAGAQVDVQEENGNAPLHRASLKGQVQVTYLLLQANADKNLRGRNGETPLYKASKKGHLNVTTLLLQAGADKTLASNEGKTPLDIAREHKHHDLVTLLEENTAPLSNGPTTPHGNPSHYTTTVAVVSALAGAGIRDFFLRWKRKSPKPSKKSKKPSKAHKKNK